MPLGKALRSLFAASLTLTALGVPGDATAAADADAGAARFPGRGRVG